MKIFRKIPRIINYYLIRLFRLKKGAKQIAIGIVVGFFPCWFPTFGIGPMASIFLTKIARGNIVSAVIATAIGSFLWPLLFYLNYWVGALFVIKGDDKPIELPEIEYDGDQYVEPLEEVSTLGDIGISFVLGSIINSILFSVVGYFVFYYIFSRYRETILKKLR